MRSFQWRASCHGIKASRGSHHHRGISRTARHQANDFAPGVSDGSPHPLAGQWHRELEPVGAHGEGVVFSRLPSVKTQLLALEAEVAGTLLTSTPRLVHSTELPAVVPVEADFAMKSNTRRTTETSDRARDCEAGGSALRAVGVESANVIEGRTSWEANSSPPRSEKAKRLVPRRISG